MTTRIAQRQHSLSIDMVHEGAGKCQLPGCVNEVWMDADHTKKHEACGRKHHHKLMQNRLWASRESHAKSYVVVYEWRRACAFSLRPSVTRIHVLSHSIFIVTEIQNSECIDTVCHFQLCIWSCMGSPDNNIVSRESISFVS